MSDDKLAEVELTAEQKQRALAMYAKRAHLRACYENVLLRDEVADLEADARVANVRADRIAADWIQLRDRVRDLEASLIAYFRFSNEAREMIDRDQETKAFKLLIAMAGDCPGYRADVTKARAVITEQPATGSELPRTVIPTSPSCTHRFTVDGLRNPRPEDRCDGCDKTWAEVQAALNRPATGSDAT